MNVHKFNNLGAAQRFAQSCKKIHLVIQGDDNKFWVCNFATAQKLEAQGYELADQF